MRWRRGKVRQMPSGRVCSGDICRLLRSRWVDLLVVLAGLMLVCVVGLVGAAGAVADPCPNQALRVGPSAGLPDCRAYELVTPADKGRTQALTFTEDDKAIAAGDGERLALETQVPLQTDAPFGPSPSELGARAVFSRTGTGWEMGSAVAPGASGTRFTMGLFNPDLSQALLKSETALNLGEQSPYAFEAGPVGGPYALVASIPRTLDTEFLGASADFSDVLFASTDHELPVSGTESAAAEATVSGAHNLYDFSDEHLHLVNAKQDGSALPNPCGATLGAGGGHEVRSTTVHAVSEDGSKIFFTIPSPGPFVSGSDCEESARLFMRVTGGEPIEVSAPEPGVQVGTPQNPLRPVRYNYATPNGSKVFFNTEMALTSDDASKANKLFEYDTEAPERERLKLVASGIPATYGVGLENLKGFFFSEDGSAVYVELLSGGTTQEIYRYDTSTGDKSLVAVADRQPGNAEPSYSTPNGEFFLFTSKSVIVPHEPRGEGSQNGGTGPNEMYRYDHANGSVVCVTCGAGNAPAQGEVVVRFKTILETDDETPPMTVMSENGQEVFFQTTAQLVPQDTNSTKTEEGSVDGSPGLDVYEWEAEGSEEAPGGFCGNVNGCTHLLSSGEDVGPARLLGASANGHDVFFESASRLAPQDIDEFPDIYDARVDGGFAPTARPLECLSCQGVGNPPPLFSVSASESFTGAGNLDTHVAEGKPKHKKKRPKAKGRHRRGSKGDSRTAGRRGRSARASGRGV